MALVPVSRSILSAPQSNAPINDPGAFLLSAIAVFYAGPVYDELMGAIRTEAKQRQIRKSANSVVEIFPQQNGPKSRDEYGNRWNVNGRYAIVQAPFLLFLRHILLGGNRSFISMMKRAVFVVEYPRREVINPSSLLCAENRARSITRMAESFLLLVAFLVGID